MKVWNDCKLGAGAFVTSANVGSDRWLNTVWKLDNYCVPFASNPELLGSKRTHFKASDSSIVRIRDVQAPAHLRAKMRRLVTVFHYRFLGVSNWTCTRLFHVLQIQFHEVCDFSFACNEEEHMAIFIGFKCFHTTLNAARQSYAFNRLPLRCKTLRLWSHSKLHFSDIYYGSDCCVTVVYLQEN